MTIREDNMQWEPFRNDSGEEVPAYALMKVTGAAKSGTTRMLLVDQPDEVEGEYVANGPSSVPDGKFGRCGRGLAKRVLFDNAETPANGEVWGAKNNSWKLTKNPDAGAIPIVGDVDGVTVRATLGHSAAPHVVMKGTVASTAAIGQALLDVNPTPGFDKIGDGPIKVLSANTSEEIASTTPVYAFRLTTPQDSGGTEYRWCELPQGEGDAQPMWRFELSQDLDDTQSQAYGWLLNADDSRHNNMGTLIDIIVRSDRSLAGNAPSAGMTTQVNPDETALTKRGSYGYVRAVTSPTDSTTRLEIIALDGITPVALVDGEEGEVAYDGRYPVGRDYRLPASPSLSHDVDMDQVARQELRKALHWDRLNREWKQLTDYQVVEGSMQSLFDDNYLYIVPDPPFSKIETLQGGVLLVASQKPEDERTPGGGDKVVAVRTTNKIDLDVDGEDESTYWRELLIESTGGPVPFVCNATSNATDPGVNNAFTDVNIDIIYRNNAEVDPPESTTARWSSRDSRTIEVGRAVRGFGLQFPDGTKWLTSLDCAAEQFIP